VISINHIRKANGTRAETDWQMRADTRKLVESLNKAFQKMCDGPLLEAGTRKDGNGIFLQIGVYDVDIDRYGNMLGHGESLVQSVSPKDLLAQKRKVGARSRACKPSGPRPSQSTRTRAR